MGKVFKADRGADQVKGMVQNKKRYGETGHYFIYSNVNKGPMALTRNITNTKELHEIQSHPHKMVTPEGKDAVCIMKREGENSRLSKSFYPDGQKCRNSFSNHCP